MIKIKAVYADCFKVSNAGQHGNALGDSGRRQVYSGIKDVFKTIYKEACDLYIVE
jgi:hypothetical protein